MYITPMKNLPQILKETRITSRISVAYICRQCGITQPTYCRYETGTIMPPLRHLVIITEIFQITLSEFFKRCENV
jgi:transcriptional regulator with XRE-family HTH domain